MTPARSFFLSVAVLAGGSFAANLRSPSIYHDFNSFFKDICHYRSDGSCHQDRDLNHAAAQGDIDQNTKDKVAAILGSMIKNLSNRKGLMQKGSTMDKVNIDISTTDAVSFEAEKILSNLVSEMRARFKHNSVADALGLVLTNQDGNGDIDPTTKQQVAAILEGMIRKLQSHK
uniref:Uncharacterized protein n=1 Tax=Noctiluca scintillans TaxID=2966 RepID=A0A7S1ACD2_NOCSC|mmetsp:Transcript_40532/g.107436  ORF Transcript_40532/g.107436 Transcript_40532/m.107436 type:complete len:173 (+) Transcript_40532:69-587(+)